MTTIAERSSFASSLVLLVLCALFATLVTSAGCDKPTSGTDSSLSEEQRKTSVAGQSPSKAPTAAPTTIKPAPITEAEYEQMMHGAFDKLEDRSSEVLFGADEPRCMKELTKCRELEKQQSYIPAAMCFEEWIDPRTMHKCRPWQLIRAGANFQRAGVRSKAVANRLEALQSMTMTEAQVQTALPAIWIDAANFYQTRGDHQRARVNYAVYLSTTPRGRFAGYASAQCEATGGPCTLESVTDAADLAPKWRRFLNAP